MSVYKSDGSFGPLVADTVTRVVNVIDYGEVYVQYYDVENFPYMGDENKWITESFDAKSGTPYLKVARHGNDNWTEVALSDAFLLNRSGTTQNAQKVFGYIKSDKAIEGLRIIVDDGIRFYMDQDQNGKIDFSNELFIESFEKQGATPHGNENIVINEGSSYLFLIDYFNWGGSGSVTLEAKVNGAWEQMPPHWFYVTNNMPLPEENVIINQPPGLDVNPEVVNVLVGETVNLMDGVQVNDPENEVGINDVVITDNDGNVITSIDTSSEHTYYLTYTVNDGVNQTTDNRTVNVVDYNFYITVDDYHTVYVNGVELTNVDNSWSTVDKYYLSLNPGENVIAVKGEDQSDGLAKISGFKAAYQKPDGTWVGTDGTWKYSLENQPANWFATDYNEGNWTFAHVITDPDSAWPNDFPAEANAEWIWSPSYKVESGQAFDSPVF